MFSCASTALLSATSTLSLTFKSFQPCSAVLTCRVFAIELMSSMRPSTALRSFFLWLITSLRYSASYNCFNSTLPAWIIFYFSTRAASLSCPFSMSYTQLCLRVSRRRVSISIKFFCLIWICLTTSQNFLKNSSSLVTYASDFCSNVCLTLQFTVS